jgi:hypothetical protein
VFYSLRFILSFHLDGGYTARQINRLVSIVFIISITSIIILDRMDIWAVQSVGAEGEGREGVGWFGIVFQAVFPCEGFRNNFYNFEEFIFHAEVGGGLLVHVKGNVT